jgi:diguanylate cyclase (GGDEF)-like protein/PAS domain S-box-containing protein
MQVLKSLVRRNRVLRVSGMIYTNTTPIRVLLVEDEDYDQFAFLRAVKQQELPYEVTVAETVSKARELLKKQDFDIAIVDHNIGPDTAFAIFDDLTGLPFLIATGAGDQELAVQAMKMGAFDYLVKDLQGNYLKTLDVIVRNALQRKLAEIELKNYRENLEILVKERTQELSETNEQLRHEIAERKQAEEMIRLQAIAMAAADNGITILDLEGNIIWANPALCKILGCLDSDIVGNSVQMLFKGTAENESILLSLQKAIRNRKKWAGEISNHRPDGSIYSVEVVTTPVSNIDGETTHFTTILHDITERVKSQKLLEYMATHDSLTNLPNRLLFSDRVNHAMANARRNKNKIAVLFLDLDDFKAVNDAFSHSQGDKLLITVSNRISNCLRETDTVSRFGGDEFAILLENINKPENIAQVAEKIIHEISQPMVIQANQYSISGSIGISIYPDDSVHTDQLIQNADAAMYRAKDRGKNTYQFYTPDMTREVMERLRIVTQLKNAVTQNDLELYYQPQVDAQHGEIIGIEALLRFFAPGKGFISPEVFIPIAEKAGMIVEIGEWVLAKACQQNQKLKQQGFNVQLSVNISGKQLNHPSLVPTVAKALKDTDIRPEMLELEITENSMFENIDYAIHVIKELKDLGVKIAIDDFGTGYSSLGYLTQLALDTIKIDKSFAHNITNDPNRMAVVRGMVAIAQALNVVIVIEGVETREQLKFFQDLGCAIIQGYYYSPPVPVSEIPAMLENGFK